ncbi:MAG: hypothetical protein MJ182_11305 [Treponema sp.]|nr:hypothetical protein [Treponema sp.]
MKKILINLCCVFFVIIAFASCQTAAGFTLTKENKACNSFRYKKGYNENKGDLKQVVYCGDGDTYPFMCNFFKGLEKNEHLTKERSETLRNNILETVNAKRTKDINLLWYEITYISEYSEGDASEECALLLLPYSNKKSGEFPLVVISHGTLIGADTGTTTYNSNYSEWWAAWYLASTGVAVLLPETPGFGYTQKQVFHPYMNKEALGVSSRDALNAAVQFFKVNKKEGIYDNGLDFNGKVALAGYSEGGFTTLALLEELQKNPVKDINLKLVLPMAAPADVSETMAECFKSEKKYPHPFYMPYCFLGWEKLNPVLLDKNRVFSEKFLSDVVPLFLDKSSKKVLEEKIDEYLGDQPCYTMLSEEARDWLFNPENSADGIAFKTLLEKNNALDVPVPQDVKVKILHSPADDSVPFENSKKLYERMKNKSPLVELLELPDDAHDYAFIDAWGYAYKFLMDELM